MERLLEVEGDKINYLYSNKPPYRPPCLPLAECTIAARKLSERDRTRLVTPVPPAAANIAYTSTQELLPGSPVPFYRPHACFNYQSVK